MKSSLVKILVALSLMVCAAASAVETAHAAPGDFLFKWGKPYLLTYPDAIAVDGSSNIYLLQNNQVLVLDKKGTVLRSWGSYGSGNGEFVYPSGLAVAGNKVYVSDAGNDRIQEFDSSGNFIKTWGSQGTGPGMFSFPEGIATDKNGNVYVSDSENARIEIFDGSGNFIRSFAGSGDGRLYYPQKLAVDGGGNIYVIDGVNIVTFSNTGNFLRKWGAAGDGGAPSGIAIDSAGNIFVGVNPYSDFFPPEKIQVFDSNGNFIRQWGSFGFNDGQFYNLGGVALDPGGNAYVADSNNDRIQIFDNAGKFLAKLGGHNADGQFKTPFGIATDPAGNVYVADERNYRVQVFDSGGNFLRKFGSLGDGPGQFANMVALATDRSGHLFVADHGGGELGHGQTLIQMFDTSGNYLRSWEMPVGDANPAPAGLAADRNGNVYVSDRLNNRIVVFDSSGNFIRTWGRFGSEDGLLNLPKGVAVDDSDNIYIVDQLNSRIQVFSSSGVFLRKWGSQGTGDGQFMYPSDIAIDGSGRVYVTEYDYNFQTARVQVFNSAGKFLGKFGSYGTGDGQFSDPLGIATSPSGGRVYVADGSLNRVSAFQGYGDQLPAGWIGRDIGSVGVVGSAAYANGTFTIKGSGADIWGSTDAFRFVYQPITGDAQIIARVATQQNTNGYAKAGVMIRNSLAANAIHATMDLTPTNGAEFLRRTSTGGSTSATKKSGLGAPYWVKLVRSGNTFTGSVSSDGVTWVAVGSSTISMGSTVYVGLIDNSHNNAVLCSATIDHVTAGPTGTDATAPTVTAFTIPATSSSLTVPITTLTASDNLGVAGYLVNESSTKPSPTASGWSTTAPGSYTFTSTGSKTLYAWAKDAAGNVSNSRSACVTISGGSLPAPWMTKDIGSVGIPGSASYSNGLFTLTGSGADIWGSVDAFRFVYRAMTGDGEVKARISSLQNTNTWAKGGVMIRQSLAADSVHAMMDITPNAGAEFSRRLTTGGGTAVSSTAGIKAPYNVRLVRKGTTFTGYISPDGVNWVQTGSATINMTGTIYVGFIINSHNNSALCTTTLSVQ